MSEFIEDILGPLSEPARDAEHACEVLSNLLSKIEKRSLRASERRSIQRDVIEYLKLNSIRQDSKLSQLFSLRMQYDYIPTIANLGMAAPQQVVASTTINTLYTADTDVGPAVTSMSEETSSELLNDLLGSPFALNAPRKCFICTIQRNKSALWTTYRLFVEGYKDDCDATATMNSFPVSSQILVARKLKSGISNQYQLWCGKDSKSWKEKAADATLTKQGVGYIGRSSSELAGENINGRIIAISVLSKSIDKLIHVTAILPSLTAVPDQENLSLVEEFCRSEDIVLLEALQLAATKRKSGLATPAMSTSSKFEAASVLRSTPPRKVSKSAGASSGVAGSKIKEMHGLAFSHDCRVKAPSRKNVVIEESNWDGSPCSSLWTTTSGPTPNPLYQMAKISEDTFALDFHSMSIFQAFCLALATFDQ